MLRRGPNLAATRKTQGAPIIPSVANVESRIQRLFFQPFSGEKVGSDNFDRPSHVSWLFESCLTALELRWAIYSNQYPQLGFEPGGNVVQGTALQRKREGNMTTKLEHA